MQVLQRKVCRMYPSTEKFSGILWNRDRSDVLGLAITPALSIKQVTPDFPKNARGMLGKHLPTLFSWGDSIKGITCFLFGPCVPHLPLCSHTNRCLWDADETEPLAGG